MRAVELLIAVPGLLLGGWLLFDGLKALLTGDYVTPLSGDYAGQLGPWSYLVSAAGLDPRSSVIKTLHVANGILVASAAALIAARMPGAWHVAVVAAIASLWYLPFGTLIGLAQLVMLLWFYSRNPQL